MKKVKNIVKRLKKSSNLSNKKVIQKMMKIVMINKITRKRLPNQRSPRRLQPAKTPTRSPSGKQRSNLKRKIKRSQKKNLRMSKRRL